jgi:membrane protease subunit (stomatin/prohibitin family)
MIDSGVTITYPTGKTEEIAMSPAAMCALNLMDIKITRDAKVTVSPSQNKVFVDGKEVSDVVDFRIAQDIAGCRELRVSRLKPDKLFVGEHWEQNITFTNFEIIA